MGTQGRVSITRVVIVIATTIAGFGAGYTFLKNVFGGLDVEGFEWIFARAMGTIFLLICAFLGLVLGSFIIRATDRHQRWLAQTKSDRERLAFVRRVPIASDLEPVKEQGPPKIYFSLPDHVSDVVTQDPRQARSGQSKYGFETSFDNFHELKTKRQEMFKKFTTHIQQQNYWKKNFAWKWIMGTTNVYDVTTTYIRVRSITNPGEIIDFYACDRFTPEELSALNKGINAVMMVQIGDFFSGDTEYCFRDAACMLISLDNTTLTPPISARTRL